MTWDSTGAWVFTADVPKLGFSNDIKIFCSWAAFERIF